MTTCITRLLAAGTAVALALAVSGCGGRTKDTSQSSTGELVIGTSLALSGPLALSGIDQSKGYQQAIKEINDDGGLAVGGDKRHVKLAILDNRSDPNTAAQQVRQLIDHDRAVALLGSCTPVLVLPQALAAEQRRVPYMTTCAPVQAFVAGNPSGWNYAWDLFFDETQQAAAVASGLKQVPSNKKVALFTDTQPDGVAERPLYQKALAAAGFDIVGDYTFPVGTTDFSSFINDAKTNGAQLVVAQMIPPDGLALWKQLKALELRPNAGFVSKAAALPAWHQTLGPLAEGTLSDGLWDVTAKPAQSLELRSGPLGKMFPDNLGDLSIAVLAYTTARILTDAIRQAGSTQADAVNEAIARTDGDYLVGKVAFDENHTFATDYTLVQWQDGLLVQVTPPAEDGVILHHPIAGLQ